MRGRTAGLLVALALVVGACGGSKATPPASGAATPHLSTAVPSASQPPVDIADSAYQPSGAAKAPAPLVIGSYEHPGTGNPYYAQHNYDLQFTASLFEGLVKVTPYLRYVPDLAETVPTIQNGGVVMKGKGMDVTWTLRQNMAWSDGQMITCDDLRATLSFVMNPNNALLTVGTAGWGDITGIDGADWTCTVHFSTVYEGYLGLFSAVLPAHYLQIAAAKGEQPYAINTLTDGVYSGPYIPAAGASSTAIVLKPNPYWSTISGHDPWLKSVTWKYYPNPAALIKGYQNGEFALGVGLDETSIPSLDTVPAGQVAVKDSLTYELLAFNNTSLKTKFGSDAQVIVRALMMAIDRDEIASGPLDGDVSVANDFVSSLSWFYRDPGGAAPADPTSAATILANAGWAKNSAGWLAKGPTTLELSFCTTIRQQRVDTLNMIAAQLKPLGIKVDVNARPNSDVFGGWATASTTPCNLVHGNFDVAEFSYISPVDPLAGYNAYVSTQTPADSVGHAGQNVTGVSIADIDRAYDTIRTTADMSAVRDAMDTLQQVYGSDRNTYELPLYFRKDVWLVKPTLQNFLGGPTLSGAGWNMGDWWLSA